MTFNTNFHIRRPILSNDHEPDNIDYYWLHKFFDHTVKTNNLWRAVLVSLSSNWYLWSTTHTGCKKRQWFDKTTIEVTIWAICCSATLLVTQCKPFENLIYISKALFSIKKIKLLKICSEPNKSNTVISRSTSYKSIKFPLKN